MQFLDRNNKLIKPDTGFNSFKCVGLEGIEKPLDTMVTEQFINFCDNLTIVELG